ncbi:MAG: FMN-binding negative transcriptional regulator [Xanthomonadales bacterium]|nr:FMN-binding negative transcriptional regulator [Xanthomonadales bacterium]
MYMPKEFRETRIEVLQDLMRASPLATVVTHGVGGFAANHLPFEVIDATTLHTHVARGNELVQMDGAEALLVFRGPDGYISPSWYPTAHETGREVPTWDYAVVHVHGHLQVIDDPVWLRRLLARLVKRHEANLSHPWRMGDAPADHIEESIKAIVGVAVTVDRIEGKFKLSQNHPERNQAGVLTGLRARHADGDVALADFMVHYRDTKA